MKWQGQARRLHRAATLIVGAQLVIWTVTGFAFSWFDFDRLQGAGDRKPVEPLPVGALTVGVDRAVAAVPGKVSAVELRSILGRPVWAVTNEKGTTLVDGLDGRVRPPVDGGQAKAIALAAHAGTPMVQSVDRVERQGDAVFLSLPVWRVRLADGHGTEVFVSPETGAVTAWRNAGWRWFDTLWSLHVLGWIQRDNRSFVAMRIVAGLALAVALTGVALLVARLTRRRVPA
jgi:hypothetical protein